MSGAVDYAERAQHCLMFALSLNRADPLAHRMFQVAARFQALAIAEAEGARKAELAVLWAAQEAKWEATTCRAKAKRSRTRVGAGRPRRGLADHPIDAGAGRRQLSPRSCLNRRRWTRPSGDA